ncbi:MAG: hypothetical protein KGJ80_09065, partial [Chloroflexota bacterium]|nr:hypothetical protein [Chloroflexota bacterium]
MKNTIIGVFSLLLVIGLNFATGDPTSAARQTGEGQDVLNAPGVMLGTPTSTIQVRTPAPKATPTFRPNAVRPTPNPNQQKNTLKPQPTTAHLPGGVKPKAPSASVAPSSQTGWVPIMSEGFEGLWPNGAWSVSGSPTWDDTSYLAHSGYWSAWCAANVLDPWTDNYADNMNAWTYYGPFNLSDATLADLRFYYWNQSEQSYDFFQWFASVDGSNYYGYQVSGDSGGWNYIDFDLTNVPTLGNITGRSSVWIAFRFASDSSVTYKGAFIDDVSLSKYVPGQVTAQGTFSYYDRDQQTLQPARYMTAYLYDSNPGGVDEPLGTTTTDSNGHFQFPSVRNWESDGTRRDLYVVWETSYNDPGNTYV